VHDAATASTSPHVMRCHGITVHMHSINTQYTIWPSIDVTIFSTYTAETEVQVSTLHMQVSTLDAVERRPQPPLVRVVPVPQPPPPAAKEMEGEIEYDGGTDVQQGVRSQGSVAQASMRRAGMTGSSGGQVGVKHQPPAAPISAQGPAQGPAQRVHSSVQGPPVPAQQQQGGQTANNAHGQPGQPHSQVFSGQQRQRSQQQVQQVQQRQPGQPPPPGQSQAKS
jgi:hypothetical protein